MGEMKESSLNWKKTIENFRNNYTIKNRIDVLFVELIANAIDAGAKTLKITVDFVKNEIKFVDDGRGMNKEEFDDYHNLSSMTKERGETIGFAGIGAKLYMDRCRYVITATIQEGEDYGRRSRWGFDKDSKRLRYTIDELERDKDTPSHGTSVIVEEPEDLKDVDLDYIRNLILDHYNFSMNGYTDRPIKITLNNELVKIRPIGDKNIHRISNEGIVSEGYPESHVKGGRKKKDVSVEGEIGYNSGSPLKGIAIVVNGKTIQTVSDLFGRILNLKDPSKVDSISGYIRCDDLIQAVETSKDKFNINKAEYKRFLNTAQKEIDKALGHWGMYKEDRMRSVSSGDFKDASMVLGELIRSENLEDIFTPGGKRKQPTTVADSNGSVNASLQPGKEAMSRRHPGGGSTPQVGNNVSEGLGNGLGLHKDSAGNRRASRATKRRAYGPPIVTVPNEIPEDKKRAKIVSGSIVVYSEHPAFKLMEKFGGARFTDKRYYLIDVGIEAICEYKGETDKEECKARLFEHAFTPVDNILRKGHTN